jgi:hypothetical protein
MGHDENCLASSVDFHPSFVGGKVGVACIESGWQSCRIDVGMSA